jgi:hypothetical protein
MYRYETLYIRSLLQDETYPQLEITGGSFCA